MTPPSTPHSRAQRVRALALEAGFDRAGIAPAGPFDEAERFHDWLARGYAAGMGYMAREPERRADPRKLRPWVRSIVALALDYSTDHPLSIEVDDDPSRGWISRYAWGRDYHRVIEARLRRLVQAMQAEEDLRGQHHWYVDYGPVLERVVARHAGLGWFGKNAMLIHPRAGSWFFLAVVLTDLDLEPDAPLDDRCGSCTACIDACPTGAIVEPGMVDARRCISYWTIEHKEAIPAELRDAIGFHLFGCDVCQDVCPWNRKAPVSREPDFQPREGFVWPDLRAWATMSDEAFDALTRGSPLRRRKAQGIRDNARSALARRDTSTNFPGSAALREALARWRSRHPRRGPRRTDA